MPNCYYLDTFVFAKVILKIILAAAVLFAGAALVSAEGFSVIDRAESSVWGKISTDTDNEKHQIGTGTIFNF